MLRNEPWESPATMHEMQQQLKTLNDENKQQWYGRPQQQPGVPPLWLGFYDPEDPPEECEGCEEECLDLFIPEVVIRHRPGDVDDPGPDQTFAPEAVRLPAASICGGTLYTNEALPNNPGWKLVALGGMGCCSWSILLEKIVDGRSHRVSFHIATDESPCIGEWHWAVSSGNIEPLVNGTMTTSSADCGDPPPTPTGTETETGSGTATPGCGSPQQYEWSEGPFPSRGWYPLTYTCLCRGFPPFGDGDYHGEVQDGTCIE